MAGPVVNGMTEKRPNTWPDPGEPPFRAAGYPAYPRGKYAADVWLVELGITVLMAAPGSRPPDYHVGPGGILVLDSAYVEELAAATWRG